MATFTLSLESDDIDFLMAVLTQQPLPYVRTSPLVNKIAGQVQQQAMQAQQAPAANHEQAAG